MGGQSIESAATLGLSFVYGVFPYIPQDPVELAKSLLRNIAAPLNQDLIARQATSVLAVFVVIADTSEEAEEMAKPLDLWMLGKQDFQNFIPSQHKKMWKNILWGTAEAAHENAQSYHRTTLLSRYA